MRWTRLLMICFVALVACAPTPTPTPPVSIAPTAILSTPLSTPIDAAASLRALFPKDTVEVQTLQVKAGEQPLWLVFSKGYIYSHPILGSHFIAMYAQTPHWTELSRVRLAVNSFESVKQVELEPNNIWLKVYTSVVLQGSTHYLIKFDNQKLETVLTFSVGQFGNMSIGDIDQDGTLEVHLRSYKCLIYNPHVCDVLLPSNDLLVWNGQQFIAVPIALLPGNEPDDLRQMTNNAVELAQAGLWKDAHYTIKQAERFHSKSFNYLVDARLISSTADERAENIKLADNKPFEHFAYMLAYGDYDAIMQQIRQYKPEELFSKKSPLFVNSLDDEEPFYLDQYFYDGDVPKWIIETTSKALIVKPDLATAYFLRGWTTYFACPRNPQMLADLAWAAQLAPSEPLFAQSVAYAQQTYMAQPAHCSIAQPLLP